MSGSPKVPKSHGSWNWPERGGSQGTSSQAMPGLCSGPSTVSTAPFQLVPAHITLKPLGRSQSSSPAVTSAPVIQVSQALVPQTFSNSACLTSKCEGLLPLHLSSSGDSSQAHLLHPLKQPRPSQNARSPPTRPRAPKLQGHTPSQYIMLHRHPKMED